MLCGREGCESAKGRETFASRPWAAAPWGRLLPRGYIYFGGSVLHLARIWGRERGRALSKSRRLLD